MHPADIWQAQYGQHRSSIDGVPKINETIVNNDTGTLAHVTGAPAMSMTAMVIRWRCRAAGDSILRIRVTCASAPVTGTQDFTNRAGFDPSQQYPLQPNGDFDIREGTVDRLNARYGQPELDELDIQFNAGVQLTDQVELYGFTALASRNSESAAAFNRAIDPATVSVIYPDGFLPVIRTNIDDRTFTIGVRGQHWDWDWDFSYGVMNSEIDWKAKDTLNPTFGIAQSAFVQDRQHGAGSGGIQCGRRPGSGDVRIFRHG